MNYLLVDSFLNIALLRRFNALYEIPTSDWLDDVIKSAAAYVTMKYRKTKHDRDLHR